MICVDLLGHGRSDRPEDLRLYSMPLFARQVAALLDHLELAAGGRRRHLARRQRRPGAGDPRARAGPGPVHRDAGARQRAVRGRRPPSPRSCSACARAGRPSRSSPASPRRSPAPTTWSTSASTGCASAPAPRGAVLEGLLLGETAPHREERLKIEQPALIVGHPRDPLHPFSDSGMLAEELANGAAGRGQLDLRVATQPGAAQRRAVGVPARRSGRRPEEKAGPHHSLKIIDECVNFAAL